VAVVVVAAVRVVVMAAAVVVMVEGVVAAAARVVIPRHATIVDSQVTLPETVPTLAWKEKIAKSSTERERSTDAASTAEELVTSPQIASNQQATKHATIADRRVILPGTVRIPSRVTRRKRCLSGEFSSCTKVCHIHSHPLLYRSQSYDPNRS